jgi:hypothetical protein
VRRYIKNFLATICNADICAQFAIAANFRSCCFCFWSEAGGGGGWVMLFLSKKKNGE